MYCDQCPEVLSGKGCTKNGPCKKHRTENMTLKNVTKKDQGDSGRPGFSVRLKNAIGFFGKRDSKKN